MKNLIYLFICLSLLISCAKKKDDPQAITPSNQSPAPGKPSGQSLNGPVTCLIDGNPKSYNSGYATLVSKDALSLTAQDTTDSSTPAVFAPLIIVVSEYKGPNTYSIYGGATIYYNDGIFSNNSITGKGTLTVTKQTSDRIIGTFSFPAQMPFSGKPDISVTEGKFDVVFK